MNNENNEPTKDNLSFKTDEDRGLNESGAYKDAQNDYQNDQPTKAGGDSNDASNTEVRNEVDEDIRALEGGPQKHPGSSGAFPVGAFDISKE